MRKMKAKIINIIAWMLIAVGVISQIMLIFVMYSRSSSFPHDYRNELRLRTIFSEVAAISILAATVFTLISRFKSVERPVLKGFYNACISLGSIILILLGREVWIATSGGSLKGILSLIIRIFGGESAWNVARVVYSVLLAVAVLALLGAFSVNVISLIRAKEVANNPKRYFLIAGYAFLAIALLAFAVQSIIALSASFDWNMLEIGSFLGLAAPTFVALVLALSLIQPRAKTE